MAAWARHFRAYPADQVYWRRICQLLAMSIAVQVNSAGYDPKKGKPQPVHPWDIAPDMFSQDERKAAEGAMKPEGLTAEALLSL